MWRVPMIGLELHDQLHDEEDAILANFLHECFAHRSVLLEGTSGVPQL